eukprot:m.113026 g.113026  ORF g.113026 m.113026 type:complete len:128 (+) comp51855_c0_seq4:90-473(+)
MSASETQSAPAAQTEETQTNPTQQTEAQQPSSAAQVVKDVLGDGIFSDVVTSVFLPGVNDGLMVFVTALFSLLLVTLVIIAVFLDANIHVIFLTLLAGGVFAAISWYMRELKQIQLEEQQAQTKKAE